MAHTEEDEDVRSVAYSLSERRKPLIKKPIVIRHIDIVIAVKIAFNYSIHRGIIWIGYNG